MKKVLFVSSSLLILWASCTKDYFDGEKLSKAIDNLEWDPEIAAPLVYSSYSIEDLLVGHEDEASAFVEIGSDKLVTLIYENDLVSLKAEDAITIPNQMFNIAYSQPISIPSYVGSAITFNGSQLNAFDAGFGNKLDSIYLKSGLLSISFSSTFQHNVSVNLSIPDATKNGIPYSTTVNLNYAGSTPVTQTATLDLTGYILDLTQNGTTYNQLQINYDIDVTGNGNPVNAGDNISVNGSISGLGFSKMFGYIEVDAVSSAPDSVDLGIFSLAQGVGTFKLVNPSVIFTIKNSIGIPMSCNFSQLQGINTNSGNSYNLATDPDMPSPLPITSPTLAQMGETVTSSFTLDGPGVSDLINDQPGFIIYAVDAATSSSAGQQGYVIDTSKFTVNMKVKMPLYGRADIFTIRDTIDFSLEGDSASSSSSSSSGSSASNDTSGLGIDLVSLTLKTIIKNGFPIDFSLQGYLLDENNVLMDSLLGSTTLIPSAQVDNSGKATTSGVASIESVYTEARVAKFKDIKKIVIVAKAATLNAATQDVKIYSDYRLSVKIGLKAKVTKTNN